MQPGTFEKRTAVSQRRKAKRLLGHSEGDRALSAAPRLRRLVADTIMASPDTYSEVVLGKPPREYAEWIVDPQHWGGQIELTVRARILFENFYCISILKRAVGELSACVWGRRCCASTTAA